MRAEIAIESMVTVMIALVGAGMLIALAFGKLPELASSMSCSAYSIMSAITPAPEGMSQPLPAYCTPKREDTPKLDKSKNQTIDELAAYILGCWEQGSRGGVNDTFSCQQLSLASSENFSIIPADITFVYKFNDLCNDRGIQDNSTGCGTVNQIIWRKSEIKNQDFVLIEYNYTQVVVR